MQTSGKKACFQFPECRLSYTKIMKASAMRACSCIAERILSYTKIQIKIITQASMSTNFYPYAVR